MLDQKSVYISKIILSFSSFTKLVYSFKICAEFCCDRALWFMLLIFTVFMISDLIILQELIWSALLRHTEGF